MAIDSFDPAGWRGVTVSDLGSLADLKTTVTDYQVMLGAVLEAMLDRHDRRGDYPFIDTKLSLSTGEDFADDDPVRGPGVVYGWIQGRGLEAVAGHMAWLRRCDDVAPALRDRLLPRAEKMLAEVFERMEAIRAANGGRLFFAMTPEGQFLKMGPEGRYVPHEVPADSPANSTELFYVKGLLAAADALGDAAKVAEARRWHEQIDAQVRAGGIAGDQQPLDPTNPAIRPVPGRRGGGGRMLALGAAALFLERTDDAVYVDAGCACIDHMLAHEVNTDPEPAVGLPFDAWEFVDADGRPWLDDSGALLSDPGHSCEFVGFALKFLHACEKRGLLRSIGADRLAEYDRVLAGMLERNFANGFSPDGYGIVKNYDLVARKPLRPDMPWWNLPETMRAAAGACLRAPQADRATYVEIASKCSNAFARHFLRPDLHLMAYQTVGGDGKPVDIIPATPDADPGYHTGLSIIDYLDWLEELDA